MAFTYDDYRNLLEQFLEYDYQFVDYDTVEADKPHVILRHDVDMSPELAHKLAEIEANLGISANYFILITSSLYNPFSGENRAHLRAISDLGHRIGLHFDASIYGDDRNTLEQAAVQELSALKTLVHAPHPVVSFHRPSEAILGNDDQLAGCDHTYMPRFVEEIGYCSDSRGQWFYQHPFAHESMKARTALQLLTHPVWWSAYRDEDAVSLLDRFTFDRMDFFRTELARNCAIYRKEILNHLSQT